MARPPSRRRALLGVALTVALMLLVAGGVVDQGWAFAGTALLVAGLAVGTLHLIFPHGLVFALGAANGLAVYVCIFAVIGQAGFPRVEGWARSVAFLLPVMGFVIACWVRRAELAAIAEGSGVRWHPERVARWLGACILIAVGSLAMPVNRMTGAGQTAVLLAAMGGVALVTAAAVGEVVRLLVEVATILRQVGRRLRHLAVPIATYVSLFALLAVAFGCFYRIADGLSRVPIFMLVGEPTHIGFSDAMHFSVVTLSTVGYGDIQPHDDGIRLLAAIQMVLGQLLLLFGFAEIMRGREGGAAARRRGDNPSA
ncbi:potassium channel family protein [Roseococcus sp. DSY-14]|uniref:potassium channel family protein n=1 Tax=Roseococcus sp. DSY-14 TaxID=3369650 RepID=UPI00387B9AFB